MILSARSGLRNLDPAPGRLCRSAQYAKAVCRVKAGVDVCGSGGVGGTQACHRPAAPSPRPVQRPALLNIPRRSRRPATFLPHRRDQATLGLPRTTDGIGPAGRGGAERCQSFNILNQKTREPGIPQDPDNQNCSWRPVVQPGQTLSVGAYRSLPGRKLPRLTGEISYA